jgi:hypothetical protein
VEGRKGGREDKKKRDRGRERERERIAHIPTTQE